ncbi:MAG: hypothetical protein AB2375_01605 [Tissierellaceae bacterium]
MKKTTRRIVSLCLTLVIVALLSLNVFAENKRVDVEVLQSTVPVDRSLDGREGSDDIVFYTGPTYPWYRIYIYNDSNVDYKVNITDSQGNNQGIRWIDPHDDIEITNENAADGMRVVNVSSRDGSALKGRIRVKIATSKSGLE